MKSWALILMVLFLHGSHSVRGTEPESPPPPQPQEQEAEKKKKKAADKKAALENTLRWTTASEVDNFGFDVYRGESPDGPFECITEQPILGAGTIDTPSDYTYVDRAIDPRREYFYYVESISMNGERKMFTPIIRAPAKQSPEKKKKKKDAKQADDENP